MPLGLKVGLDPSDIVLDGEPASRSPKGPQFSARVCYGQTARWIKMPLGMEVSLGPGHIVLDGDPAPLPKKGAFVRSFFTGRSPAYSELQRVGRQQAQCACPRERGGELVVVCSVCATCRKGGLSSHEQLVPYLLMSSVKAWLTV